MLSTLNFFFFPKKKWKQRNKQNNSKPSIQILYNCFIGRCNTSSVTHQLFMAFHMPTSPTTFKMDLWIVCPCSTLSKRKPNQSNNKQLFMRSGLYHLLPFDWWECWAEASPPPPSPTHRAPPAASWWREREREREEMSLDPPIMSIGDKLNIDPDKQWRAQVRTSRLPVVCRSSAIFGARQ